MADVEGSIRSNFTVDGEELTEKQIDNFLWHCTAFPVASKEKVREQIDEMAEKTEEYHEAMSIAEKRIEEAMDNLEEKD